MQNKLSTNNLFSYATSELSQDAFICWLLSHAMEENWNKNSDLREVAVELLTKILESKNLKWENNTRVTNIQRQYNKIDILVSIGDLRIIIEDKTFTGLHDNQINFYKQKLVNENIVDENIICVFYKIIEQPLPLKDVNFEITRDYLLEIFQKHIETRNIGNAIFRDYVEHLEWIKNEVNFYKFAPVSTWTKNTFVGFYKHLGNTIFKEENFSWGYVSNPSGGFMGFWLNNLLDRSDLDKMNLTSQYCDNLYIQIEDSIVTIKYSLNKDKYKNNEYDIDKIEMVRNQLFDYFKSELRHEFKKKKPQMGKTMTVGYVQYNENNYCEIFSELRELLVNMIDSFSIRF